MMGHCDETLVFFSILVAIAAAYTAFDLIDRLLSSGRRIYRYLLMSSFMIGIGIWSMHFIGILAFHPGVPVAYDAPLLLLTMLLPVGASFVSLCMVIGKWSSKNTLIAGGVVVGLAVAAMHYIGMYAMEMPAQLVYHPFAVAVSVVISLLVPFVAIFLCVRYRVSQLKRLPLRVKTIGALVLGFGFAAIHYSGMAGTSVQMMSGNGIDHGDSIIGNSTIAGFVGGATLLLLATVLVGAFIDRNRALRQVEDSERRYMSLFEHSPDMVVCFDPAGNRIVSANPAVYTISGYSPDELERLTWRQLFHSDRDLSSVRRQLLESAKQEHPRKLEFSIVGRGARPLLLSATIFPLDIDGKPFIYAICRDITEQKQAEHELLRAMEEAENANRVKGEFLAIMSHEIRTPLNGIVGINQIMLETELTDKQHEMLLVQEKSGQALLRVINDVLDFSKIEAGTVALSDDLFHLPGCLEECAESFSVAAQNKGIALNVHVDEEIPQLLHGDPIRLRQIVVNLLGNAVKFTESGSVCLEARLAGAGRTASADTAVVEFKVTDTGIGIDPSRVHLLFLPFSQILDASKGRNYEGTGLGLAICRDLVELMGGEIWVEAGRKTGAAFGFRIPFRRMQSEHEAGHVI